MKLYSNNREYEIYHGDMLDALEVIEPDSVDSVVCDPPYELNFMNKGWDNAGVSFQADTWKKCYEVLKPGGYLLAFGGTRTFHRIACAIEDAGFEIRDTIMWLYGSGFPKSRDIGLIIDKRNGVDNRTGKIVKGMGSNNTESMNNHAYDSQNYNKEYEERKATNKWGGWGMCLKPAYEPIIVARKPFKGSLVDNILEYGVGGINIDECRVETGEEIAKNVGYKDEKQADGWGTKKCITEMSTQGRFPANVIHDGSEEVCADMPTNKGGGKTKVKGTYGFCFGEKRDSHPMADGYDDAGSVSRYFYCAKANKKDRDEGLDGSPYGHSQSRKNIHPTVKPTELMQYLVRLVTPKGGTVFDPFMGSGSTGKAVVYENKERDADYKFVGIELNEEYCDIAKRRIEHALGV